MVVIIMGVTASGKTTVGRRLAGRVGWPFYDADDFHPPANVAKMSRGEPLTDVDRQPWLAALHDVIARHVGEGTSAVLACSALKQAYRATLRGDLPASAVAFAYLKGDPELLQRRLSTRTGHFMPKTMLPSQLAALEEPAEGLILDAGAPVPRLVREIMAAYSLAPAPRPATGPAAGAPTRRSPR